MIAKVAAAALGALIVVAATPSYARPCPGAANRQICCSARACTGRILSSRDRHNCKVKSRGKSWHARNGACVNL
jgi:hypothetical protein